MKLKPLTPRQANALQMTLDGHRRDYICEKLGITQKTLWTWRRLPAWDEQVTVALKESSGDGQAQVKTLLPIATQVLRRLLLTSTDQVRLGAARTVLEAHANLVAREEQQQVLMDLESRLEELQGVARNQGLLPHAHEVIEPVQDCVTVFDAGTQEDGQPSADQDVQEVVVADGGQDPLIGQGSGPVGQDRHDLEVC